MHFELDYEFAASMEACEAAFLHPEYDDFVTAHSETISNITIELREDDGVVVRVRKRITTRAPAERIGPIKIEPKWLRFVEESTWDRRTRQLRFKYIPEHEKAADKIVVCGDIAYEETAPSTTRSHARFDIKVQNLPLWLRPFTSFMEDLLVRETKRTSERQIETMRVWLAELWQRPAASQQPVSSWASTR